MLKVMGNTFKSCAIKLADSWIEKINNGVNEVDGEPEFRYWAAEIILRIGLGSEYLDVNLPFLQNGKLTDVPLCDFL
jgi:hypothetical protein